MNFVRSLCIMMALLLVSQHANCNDVYSIKEFSLRNCISVVLHENTRSPRVLIGVIFHVGAKDAPLDKIGITDLVAVNFINKKIRNVFMQSGISYKTSVFNEYTEIFAEMNPKKIKEFFDQICASFSEIKIEDLAICKKQMIIENKMETYFFNNALKNNVFSNINPREIFNESSLASITENDIVSFFKEKFQTCKVSVIVVGSIKHKDLVKALDNSIGNLPKRTQEVNHKDHNKKIIKDIQLESKYTNNSARYVYSCEKLEETFLSILRHEMFRFFCKTHSLITYFSINDISINGNNICTISLFPKKDVSIDDLQKFYDVFVKKITTTPIDNKILSTIADRKKMETKISFSNLFHVYRNIKNAHIRGINLNSIYTISDDIKNSNPETIKSSAEKFFSEDLISTVTTRFRADK